MKTTLTYKFSRYIVKNKIRSVRDIIWYIRNVHPQKRRNLSQTCSNRSKKLVETLDIPRLSVMWEPSISKSCKVTFFLFGRSLLNMKQNFEDYNNLIFANSIKRVIFFPTVQIFRFNSFSFHQNSRFHFIQCKMVDLEAEY